MSHFEIAIYNGNLSTGIIFIFMYNLDFTTDAKPINWRYFNFRIRQYIFILISLRSVYYFLWRNVSSGNNVLVTNNTISCAYLLHHDKLIYKGKNVPILTRNQKWSFRIILKNSISIGTGKEMFYMLDCHTWREFYH